MLKGCGGRELSEQVRGGGQQPTAGHRPPGGTLRPGSSGLPPRSGSPPAGRNGRGGLGLPFSPLCFPLAAAPRLSRDERGDAGRQAEASGTVRAAEPRLYDRRPRALLEGRARAEEEPRCGPGQRPPYPAGHGPPLAPSIKMGRRRPRGRGAALRLNLHRSAPGVSEPEK